MTNDKWIEDGARLCHKSDIGQQDPGLAVRGSALVSRLPIPRFTLLALQIANIISAIINNQYTRRFFPRPSIDNKCLLGVFASWRAISSSAPRRIHRRGAEDAEKTLIVFEQQLDLRCVLSVLVC